MYPDPFREQGNVIVMCAAYVWADENFTDLKPANTNFRHFAKNVWDAVQDEKPWYGIEQEYSLLE